MRRSFLLFVLLCLLAAWAVRSGRIVVPDAWNPWAPLRIDAEPNLLTGFKLARASADDRACRDALAQAEMRYEPVPDRVTGPGCGFDNAVRISRTSIAIDEPFTLSCRAALSLAMWERHDLQRAAREELGTQVESILHYGSYACRNLYGEEGRRRSRHATADAFDIRGFELVDGRRLTLQDDWVPASATTGDTPEDRFLRAARDGACRWFDVVLGPEYNAAHADHFHLDRGGGRICR